MWAPADGQSGGLPHSAHWMVPGVESSVLEDLPGRRLRTCQRQPRSRSRSLGSPRSPLLPCRGLDSLYGPLEAPTGHRTDCSTPTAAVARGLTVKPTLLTASGGRGAQLCPGCLWGEGGGCPEPLSLHCSSFIPVEGRQCSGSCHTPFPVQEKRRGKEVLLGVSVSSPVGRRLRRPYPLEPSERVHSPECPLRLPTPGRPQSGLWEPHPHSKVWSPDQARPMGACQRCGTSSLIPAQT